MKKLTFLLALLWLFHSSKAQELKPGTLVGVHNVEIKLKPGVTFKDYYKELLDFAPKYSGAFEGVTLVPVRSIRGECDNCFGFLMVIESDEIRNKYMGSNGLTAEGLKSIAKIEEDLAALEKFGTYTSTYTDWIVKPKPDMITGTELGITKTESPLKGSWGLIEGNYSGKDSKHNGEIFQYKIFDDRHFSLSMKTPEGKWERNGIGTYTIDDDTFTETFISGSDTQYNGVSAEWKYEMQGDTLITNGPIKIFDKDGNPVFQDAVNSMREVRIRLQ